MVKESARQCPVELAMNLINKKWVIQLLRDMFFGVSRFNEFKEADLIYPIRFYIIV